MSLQNARHVESAKLSIQERRRHPIYLEGYNHFKGRSHNYSCSNPYGPFHHGGNLAGELWSRGAEAAL